MSCLTCECEKIEGQGKLKRYITQSLRLLDPPCYTGTKSRKGEGRREGINKGLNQQMTRRLNKVALLRLLHIHGPKSRVELAASLGLNTKTLTNLSRDLLGRGFVESAGMANGSRGRPREMLQLSPSKLNAIGLHLEEHKISGALVGFDGSIRDRRIRQLSGNESQSRLKELVADMARQLSVAAKGQTIGTGLTFPGVVDHGDGVVLKATHLPVLVGVNMVTLLDGVCKGPVLVEAFTTAKALAERWFGAGTDVDDFILLDAGVGIGCAAVVQGRLIMGHGHMAGEIGHVVMLPDGEPCTCGRRGCLETVASLGAMLSRAGIDAASSGSRPQDLLAERLQNGDKGVQRVVEEAGRYIGIVLSSLVAALNPSRVVLTGDALALGPLFTRTVSDAVMEFTLPQLTRDLTVVPSRLGQDAALLGAAVLGLQSLFDVG